MSQLQALMEERAAELRSLRLEVEMLTQKVNIHKDEFSRLETTSSTKIAQLEAALDLEVRASQENGALAFVLIVNV